MIKELIVVEGKNDAHAVRNAMGNVEIIWTEGYGITKETLDYIKKAVQNQGVIIFTDPDSVGEQIRERITRIVPGVKHVYLSQKQARYRGDIGVENADIEDIRHAFSHIHCLHNEETGMKCAELTMDDLLHYGLAGNLESRAFRVGVGRILGIGDTNAKQFLQRLRRFNIDKAKLEEGIKEYKNGKCC